MSIKNNKFTLKKGFPMKICFLKNEEKEENKNKNESPSIAFLSSIIQS
jgi:hypothetical protein